ncbi:MAG: hypothetical protein ABEJ27_06565 [Halodesulfurarchaeum sp.]
MMHAIWYCHTCEERIDKEAIAAHEADDHHVKGVLRPDRLLSNDPWTVGDESRPPDAGPTAPEDIQDPPITDEEGEY